MRGERELCICPYYSLSFARFLLSCLQIVRLVYTETEDGFIASTLWGPPLKLDFFGQCHHNIIAQVMFINTTAWTPTLLACSSNTVWKRSKSWILPSVRQYIPVGCNWWEPGLLQVCLLPGASLLWLHQQHARMTWGFEINYNSSLQQQKGHSTGYQGSKLFGIAVSCSNQND